MPDDLESDIEATAEDITADATILQAIESEKAALDSADPRALELAREAEQLVRSMASKAAVERALVTEVQEGGDGSDATELEPEG